MYELLSQILAYAQGMWRFRWYGLLLAWFVCAIGWTYVFALTDQYESTARVHIDTQSLLKPLLKGLAVDSDVKTRVNVMTRTLLSRPNLEKVARDTDLDLRAETPAQMEALIANLQQTIKISSPRRRENIYAISFTHSDPQMAQQVVQNVVNKLVEGTLGSSREDVESAQRFLNEQIGDYSVRLETAEQRLAEFKKRHVGMMPNEGGGFYARLQTAMDKLDQTQTGLKVAENRRDELLKQIETEKHSGDSVITSDLVARIEEREVELDALLLNYTEQHPDVLALKQTIARLKERRKRVAQQFDDNQGFASGRSKVYQAMKIELSKAEVEVATSRAQAADQRRKINELRRMVDTIPEVEANLTRLNRDYAITKDQYEKLVQRRESARLSEQADQSNDDMKFRVIDPPIVPLDPIGPDRQLYLSAVFLVGLLASVVLTFFLNDIRPVFLSSKSLQEATGLPVLGVVSMKWQPKQHLRLRTEYASFVFLAVSLMIAFGGVLVFEDTGVRAAQSLVRMI